MMPNVHTDIASAVSTIWSERLQNLSCKAVSLLSLIIKGSAVATNRHFPSLSPESAELLRHKIHHKESAAEHGVLLAAQTIQETKM